MLGGIALDQNSRKMIWMFMHCSTSKIMQISLSFDDISSCYFNLHVCSLTFEASKKLLNGFSMEVPCHVQQ